MEERRKYVRLDTAVQVQYKILTEGNGISNGQSRNISAGGIRINMKENVIPSTQVDLEIYLPGEIGPIKAIGEVVWQEELNVAGKANYDTGIKFTKIDVVDRNRLNQYILNLLRDRMHHIGE